METSVSPSLDLALQWGCSGARQRRWVWRCFLIDGRTSSSPFCLRRHTAEHVGGGPSSVRQWRCAAVGKNGPPCPVRLAQLVSDGELSGEDGSRRLSGEKAASTP
nr:hypothetical protein Itr_chr03CG08200 [Ipomoea trifida]